ncbi:hypothetical protein CDAR_449601 [Caerostris darwini]|uniref:LAGLIDADG homing endonuclease n=1 Tax=Caerostris darwini TaxID=1538125 RepID=A0AAV4QRX8_9ARAC|nr:hypothetical protein CDAR_449601 [Caerostris darwini]
MTVNEMAGEGMDTSNGETTGPLQSILMRKQLFKNKGKFAKIPLDIYDLNVHIKCIKDLMNGQLKFLKDAGNIRKNITLNPANNSNEVVKRTAESILKHLKFFNVSWDGFKSPPKKHLGKSKNVFVPFQITMSNKFALINEDNLKESSIKGEVQMHTPSKPPPIMLTLLVNCTLALQEIYRKFPGIEKTLTKGYIKMFPTDKETYRKIINVLAASKCEYYVNKPLKERPLKVILK